MGVGGPPAAPHSSPGCLFCDRVLKKYSFSCHLSVLDIWTFVTSYRGFSVTSLGAIGLLHDKFNLICIFEFTTLSFITGQPKGLETQYFP
jgi:hypothetical protein